MNQQLRKDLSRIDPIVAVVIFGVGFAYLAVHQSFIGFWGRGWVNGSSRSPVYTIQPIRSPCHWRRHFNLSSESIITSICSLAIPDRLVGFCFGLWPLGLCFGWRLDRGLLSLRI